MPTPDEEFDSWLSGLRSRARAQQAPIEYYETEFGPAQFNAEAGTFEGDEFSVSMDDVTEWRPVRRGVRSSDGGIVRGRRAAARRERQEGEFSNFSIPARANRTPGERFMFDAWEAQTYGSNFFTPFPAPEEIGPGEGPRGARGWRTAGSARYHAERALQGRMGAEDPWYEAGESWVDPARWVHGGAALTGTFAGAISDPLNLIMPGSRWYGRVAFQAGLGGAQNTGEQLAGGSRTRYRTEDSVRLGRELDRIYREEGGEALDRALTQLDAVPEEEEPLFDWFELGLVAGASGLMQGAFEGAGALAKGSALRRWEMDRLRETHAAGGTYDPSAEWRPSAFETVGPDGRTYNFAQIYRPYDGPARPASHVDRALGYFGAPFIRAATRAQVRSLGDPALDALARREDGSIDPAAVPIREALEQTPVWMQQMTPVVERAALATTSEQRAAAYAEAALRMNEALGRGEDPMEFVNAIIAARFRGELPDLRAFDTLEAIGREISNGSLVIDQFGATARSLSRLTEALDPAIARLRQRRRTFRAALRNAEANLSAVRRAEAEARPPVEVGVGDAHMPARRTVTDDERADIDAVAAQVAERRTSRRGLSLAAWVIKRGGLLDEGGDLGAAVGGFRARPGLVRRQGGKNADDLALAAWEAGYFPEFHDRPEPRVLIDALAEEVNGRQARFPKEDQDDLVFDEQYRAVESWLERHGVDPQERDIEALKRAIAENVYEATYARPLDEEGDAAPDAGSPAEATASPAGRPSPPGWGVRQGQAAGMGGGGAQRSPLARVEGGITPIPRQTLIRRAAREAKRRGVATYISDVIAHAYTAIFESQHPIVLQQRALVEEIERLTVNPQGQTQPVNLRPSEDPRVLARLSRDSYSAGHLDLMDGVRPYRQPGVKASPSFREAIETATGGREWSPARILRFEAYLIAKRGVKAWDRYAAGDLPRPPHAMSRLDLADAIRQAEQDHPEFVQGAALLYRFLEAHWQKKRDAGLITEAQYQAGLKNNEDYVPFMRDMDDSGAKPSRGGEGSDAPAQSGGGQNKRRAFQRFRGSDRRILSPLSTIMADVYATSDRIARNETFRAFTDLAERAGPMGEYVAKKLNRPMDRTSIDIVEEAERAVVAAGGSQADAKALGGQLDALLNGDTSRVIYRPGEVVEGNRHVIYVWRDGVREAWELTDPAWSQDLFKAMTGLTAEARDMFMDVIAIPTQAIRTAITSWPGFIVANVIRDSLSAWMVTDVGYKPGEAVVGAAQTLTQGKLAKIYNAVGSQGGGMVRAALPRSRVQRDLPALRSRVLRTRNLDPREGAATLWRAFETGTELSENASRIRLFARAFQRAKSEGMTDYDAALWAGFESRDYLDFQRSGSRMLNFRRVALFLNAALQGLDRTVRTMTAEGDPKLLLKPVLNMMQRRQAMDGLSDQQRYEVGRSYKYFVKFALVGVIGLMLRALWGDDEDYEYGYSDYVKNNYWLIRQGRNAIAIPKPFEHAVMSNILERAYEGNVRNDPQAWDRLVHALGEAYIPPHEITAANLPIQLYANRTQTGAPIVPEGLEDLDPHLQFTATTSQLSIDFAQGLSEHAGIEVSPAQLDHVFGGVGGEFFRTPARVLDGNAPAMNSTDIPILNRFYREPGRGGTPQRVAFNDLVMRQSGALNRASGTLRDLRERGDVEGIRRFLEDRDPYERTFAVLATGFETEDRRLHPMNRARAVVTEIGRIRRELQGGRALAAETLFLPDLTPRQRRDALEALDDLSSAEMQAALVMSGAPGFAGRPMMDVPARYERLDTIAPGVSILLRARLLAGDNKAVEFETVRSLWPDAQRRLDADGFRADLGDLSAIAAADFGSATLRQMELEAEGGRRRSRAERDRELESLEEQAQP